MRRGVLLDMIRRSQHIFTTNVNGADGRFAIGERWQDQAGVWWIVTKHVPLYGSLYADTRIYGRKAWRR